MNTKKIFKKSQEELQQYLSFKQRGYYLPNKKEKGSYKRKGKYEREDT